MTKVKYPIFFKAMVLEGKKKLNLRDVEIKKKPSQNQVLVKMIYSGICGKQVEEFTFKMGKDKFIPHMLGHEGSAIVVDIGPGVKHLNIGDYVVVHWMKNFKGKNSETPFFNYKNSKRIINAGWVTTFSEFSIVSSNRVTKIKKSTDMRIAALMGCCLTTGIGAVFNQAKANKNQKHLVIGSGGVGLSVIIGLKIKGCKSIDVLDVNKKSLLKAKKFGVSKIFTFTQFKREKNLVYDNVFVASGSKGAVKSSNYIKPPCNIYFIGVPKQKTFLKIDANEIHNKKNFQGTCGGEINPDRDINKFLNLYKKNKNLFKKLILSEKKINTAKTTINNMSHGEQSHGRNLIKF